MLKAPISQNSINPYIYMQASGLLSKVAISVWGVHIFTSFVSFHPLNEKENISLKLNMFCSASDMPPSQGIQLLKLIKMHHSGMLVHWPRTRRGN